MAYQQQNNRSGNRTGDSPGGNNHKAISFRNSEGKIEPDLFDKTAKGVAKVIASTDRSKNKSTQLRRFYDELVMWEEKVRQNPGKFEENLPFIRMLKAKAAYAQGRKLVDCTFVDLVEQTIDFIKSADDLRIAKLFFEAFLGFYKLEKGD